MIDEKDAEVSNHSSNYFYLLNCYSYLYYACTDGFVSNGRLIGDIFHMPKNVHFNNNIFQYALILSN